MNSTSPTRLWPRLTALLLTLLASTGVLGGCGSDDGYKEITAGYGASLDEAQLAATFVGKRLTVTLPLAPLGSAPLKGKAEVKLVKLGEKDPLDSASANFTLGADPLAVTVELDAPEVQSGGDLGGYALHYEVSLPEGTLRGRRSLYMAVARDGLAVIGNDRFVVGEEGMLRVISLRADGSRLAGRQITVTLEAGGRTRVLSDKKTGANGELEIRLLPSADEQGSAQLKIVAGVHKLSQQVVIEGEKSQVLLTTDKPLYQPGQIVHIRALAMRQPQVVPLANQKVLFEIEDPAGNKLLEQHKSTDAHGIVSHRFVLSRLGILGAYTVRVTVDGTTRERSFKVDRYTLPKFKVQVGTNMSYAKPGEMLSGWIQADYFFGKPVKQAAVKLKVSMANVADQEIMGRTDAQGRFNFAFKSPSKLTGKLALNAEVTDTSGATARGAATVTLSKAKVDLRLVSERRYWRANRKNRIFVLLTDPAGAPRAGRVEVAPSSYHSATEVVTVNVPTTGIAVVELESSQPCAHNLLAVVDGVKFHAYMQCRSGEALYLDSDKALYGSGEKAKVTLEAPKGVNQATVEVLRQNATAFVAPLTLVAGKGELEIPLGGDLQGTLTLKTYALVGGRVLSDRKLIRVVRDDQLEIKVSADKTTYRPAETATLTVQLEDASGKPTAGALGVQIVDEALYALSPVKPGIERAAFYLDQELLTSSQGLPLIDGQVLLSATPNAEQQLQARVLFAAAGDKTSYPIDINTLKRDFPRAVSASRVGLRALLEGMDKAFEAYFDADNPQSEAVVKSWASSWLAGRVDDFGQPLQIDVHVDEGYGYGGYADITVSSAGMDERFQTNDDLRRTISSGGYWGHADSGAAFSDAASPSADGGVHTDGGQAPTLRQNFPETLFVDPAVITDSHGKATITVPLADSVTSWRMTSIAHSAAGQLGSSTAAITVFQPFFVDTVLPAQLLQNDEVEIPVAVYNYLQTAQTVTVELKNEPWFELLDSTSKQVQVPAKGVTSATFRLRAKKVGTFAFTATGRAAAEADAVKRSIRVLPDGARKEIVRSGVLEPGTTRETITIPQSAIDGASELYVKVYPGILSEVMEGFESILRKPYGCFEQTSSATYPNVMVLQYLKSSAQSTPALEQKAKAFIADGYQRLVAYEVSGGGFSLWGDPPANIVLSAFGLMEFTDMSKVRYVDKALLARTQSWLVAQQGSDGSFSVPEKGFYEIPGNAAKGALRTTAYVTWALAKSGYKGPALNQAVSYLRSKVQGASETYTQALVANALLTLSSTDSDGLALLTKLEASAIADGPDSAYWDSQGCSVTYGYGRSMTVETTALVVGALLLGKKNGGYANKGLRHLTLQKGAHGGYGTTQATVLGLRALLMALEARGGDQASGTLEVLHGGALQGSATVTPQTSDVTRLFDLKQVLVEGSNQVDISFTGKGELAYQVVGIYYEPHGTSTSPGPLSFSVAYDKTSITLAESIRVTAKVSTTGSGAVPTMMMRLGLPPGFKVNLSTVEQLPSVRRAERDGPFLVLYFNSVAPQKPLEVSLEMTPTIALKGRAPASSAYPYYTPEYTVLAQTPVVTVVP